MKTRLEKLHRIINDSIREVKKKTTSFHAKGRIAELVLEAQREIKELEYNLEVTGEELP